MIFLDDTQHLFLQYSNLTRHQMKSSNAIDVQNGIKTHPVMIKEIFWNFSWKIFVTLFKYLFRCFCTGDSTQPSSRKMNKIFVHDPVSFSSNIQTHLKYSKEAPVKLTLTYITHNTNSKYRFIEIKS